MEWERDEQIGTKILENVTLLWLVFPRILGKGVVRNRSATRYLKAPERVPFLFQGPLFRIRTRNLGVMSLALEL